MKYLHKRKMNSYVRVPNDGELQNLMGYSRPKVTIDEDGSVVITFEDKHGNIVRIIENPDGTVREVRSIPKNWINISGI